MDAAEWQRQTKEKILFPELLWAKPQNNRQAGKLLIIGGSQQNFSAIAEAYNQATKAGIGSARVLLPQALQKVIGNFFPEAIFAPSTASGSFSSSSVAELLGEASWADAVLIGGNLGNNSETAIAFESFMNKFGGAVVVAGDSIELLMPTTKTLLVRPSTTMVLEFPLLQRLLTAANYKTAVTSTLDFMQIVNILGDFTKQYSINVVTEYVSNIVVATHGKVSTTKIAGSLPNTASLAAFSAVWLIQNPKKSFEALSTAAAELLENDDK
jgi:hypothetical protein